MSLIFEAYKTYSPPLMFITDLFPIISLIKDFELFKPKGLGKKRGVAIPSLDATYL